jgi:hypothetical protein
MKTRHLWRSRPRVEELEGRWVPNAVPVAGYSQNWSGYAVTTGNGAVTAVSGNWVVPAVSPTNSGYSSAWVGIDGVGRNATVEQIGTDSDYVNGAAQYYAWYEMYPAAPVYLSNPVAPGDTISASVNAVSPGTFLLRIADGSSWSFSTTQTLSSAKQNTAEWIMEAPSNFFGVLPLANFGTINFSQAQATISNTTGPAGNGWSGTTLYQVNMVTSSGSLKASPGPLTDSGSPATSSFSVKFVSSGTSGGGGGGGGGGHHGNHSTTNVQPDPSQVSLSLTTTRALIQSGTTPQAPTVPPSVAAAVAPPSAVIVPSTAPLFGQPPVTVAARAQDTGDSSPVTTAAGQATAPELLPPPTVSDEATGGGAAPANPDSADPAPPTQPGASLDPGRMGDAAFADGRWEPSAPVEATMTPAAGTANDATAVESAGLALTLALGGTWGIAMRETAARRRLPQLGRS